MGIPAGLDKRRRMKLRLVCSVVILIAVIDNATGKSDPCACLHDKVHTTIKAQLKCEAGCMKKGSGKFPEYDPQREKDLRRRKNHVKYVCYPWPENANKETDEGQPDTWRPPKDCSEIRAFYDKLDDADQMYDKMEKLISEAEQKFGIEELNHVKPPELEDLEKRSYGINFKCWVPPPVRPSLRIHTRNHGPFPALHDVRYRRRHLDVSFGREFPNRESKECLAADAFRKKFRAARAKIYDHEHGYGKNFDEVEKIVGEAEKKWGIWKPDPLSERFSNIRKQVDHIKKYCKFRIANHKTLVEHLKGKDCFDEAALAKVFVATDDMFEKMVTQAEKLVSDAKEEWGIEEDK